MDKKWYVLDSPLRKYELFWSEVKKAREVQ